MRPVRKFNSPAPRGFTLTELLVAIGILIVVIVATARIFTTVSKVTGAGEANADLLQTAQAIEKAIRTDVAHISRDGYMVIESIEVANNVNGAGAPLLQPALSPGAMLRCDRIVFFTEGTATSTQFAGSQQVASVGGSAVQDTLLYTLPVNQAQAARIYYGHGVQVPSVARDPTLAGADPYPILSSGLPLTPWTFNFWSNGYDLTMQKWDTGANVKDVNATQPSAPQWILARQPILLADDGVNGFLYYNQTSALTSKKNSTMRLFFDPPTGSSATYDPKATSSRVDISGHTLDKLRADVTANGTNSVGATRIQMTRVLDDLSPGSIAVPMRFPRVERVAPSMDRADQMLTNPVLAAGCSSFAVEWTWANGTGRVVDGTTQQPVDPTPAAASSGDEWIGMYYNGGEQPWFGYPNTARGVYPLSQAIAYSSSYANTGWGCYGPPIYPGIIEGVPALTTYGSGVQVYRAVFGYNDARPFTINETSHVAQVNPDVGYTPWPTALRFTITLHDPGQRFAEGRTFQFVVELPRH